MSPRVATGSACGGPPGTVWAAATSRGVVLVCLGSSREGFLGRLAEMDLEPGGPRAWIRPALLQIGEYFSGRRRKFSLRFCLPRLAPFSSRVVARLLRVPFGATITYGELARRAGSPGAARAVGRVMAQNPLPLIVPCHRVVAASGLGGFGGGLKMKRDLLCLEGHPNSVPGASRHSGPATRAGSLGQKSRLTPYRGIVD